MASVSTNEEDDDDDNESIDLLAQAREFSLSPPTSPDYIGDAKDACAVFEEVFPTNVVLSDEEKNVQCKMPLFFLFEMPIDLFGAIHRSRVTDCGRLGVIDWNN